MCMHICKPTITCNKIFEYFSTIYLTNKILELQLIYLPSLLQFSLLIGYKSKYLSKPLMDIFSKNYRANGISPFHCTLPSFNLIKIYLYYCHKKYFIICVLCVEAIQFYHHTHTHTAIANK